MEMTKQRKMLIGVLCIGLSGLAIDRFFLMTPDTASADDSEESIELPAPLTPSLLTVPEPAAVREEGDGLPSYASLTERLVLAQQVESVQGIEASTDPFALPQQWRADRSTPTLEALQPSEGAGQRLSAVFTLDGTVRSVIDDKEEIMAVISGGGLDSRAIRVGQKIRVTNRRGEKEEFKLIEVGSRYVVWKSEKTHKTVEMKVEGDL